MGLNPSLFKYGSTVEKAKVLKIQVLRDVTPYRLVNIEQRLGG
jgi:hypothetical protein